MERFEARNKGRLSELLVKRLGSGVDLEPLLSALGAHIANPMSKEAQDAFLASLGVSADKIETVSKGSLESAKNGDDTSTAKDRRVELVVVNPSTAPAPL